MIRKTTPNQAQSVPAAINGRIMHNEDPLEVILLTLTPGESIPFHQNPSDVLFAGIKGKGTINTLNQTHILEQGETIFITRDEQRSLQNTEKEVCKIFVIKIKTSC